MQLNQKVKQLSHSPQKVMTRKDLQKKYHQKRKHGPTSGKWQKKREQTEYIISYATKKVVPERKPGNACQNPGCMKQDIACTKMTEQERCDIFNMYYHLADTQLQRELISRHVSVTDKIQQQKGNPGETRLYIITLQSMTVRKNMPKGLYQHPRHIRENSKNNNSENRLSGFFFKVNNEGADIPVACYRETRR